MIIMIDNYDSFVYNIYQYIKECFEDIDLRVYRPEKLTLNKIKKLNPEKIIISPGPKRPSDAIFSKKVIKTFYKEIPILGVCLGHQCIGEVFGAKIDICDKPYHAKKSIIKILKKDKLFKKIPNEFIGIRYHSLKIYDDSFDKNIIQVLARAKDNNDIMGIKIKGYNVFGIQFHPESIMTEFGKEILSNFVKI